MKSNAIIAKLSMNHINPCDDCIAIDFIKEIGKLNIEKKSLMITV